MYESGKSLQHEIIKSIGSCGHFLHFKMREKAGRRRIFSVLSKYGELPQKELQSILGVCSGSLSEILAKTETDGYIEKVRSKSDGRQIILRLTDSGRTKSSEMQAAYEEKISLMLSCLSDEEQKNLLEMLDILINHWSHLDECGEFQPLPPARQKSI